MEISVSNREYKIQIPYDSETQLLDLDRRFLLEKIDGQPKAYICTSVDVNTDRYEDGMNGFITLNLTENHYNAEKDNAELMIADYLPPVATEPQSISWDPDMKTITQGCATVFRISLGGDTIVTPTWTVELPTGLESLFTVKTGADGTVIITPEVSKKTYLATVKLIATSGELTAEKEVKVVIGF